MAEELKKGIVYIVQNPAFSHLFKIGRTGKATIEERGLNASNVPEDFEVLFGYECSNPEEVEEHLQEICKEFRHYSKTGRKTEFFYVGCLLKAIRSLRLLKGVEISGDDVSLEEDDKAEYDEKKDIEIYSKVDPLIKGIYYKLSDYIKSLGNPSDITENKRKVFYSFFKKKTYFIGVQPRKERLVLMLKLDPENIEFEEGFTKDMRELNAFAAGDLEVRIENEADFEKAKPLIKRAYEEN